MGAPGSGIAAAEQPAAETLLGAFKSIDAAERSRHASVLSYWLSIRGDKEFPPLHDLDPLQISEAGPSSVLLELISGGHDAEIRHLGEDLRAEAWPEQIMDAPNPSILSCIAKKLPIVAISRDFLAFEEEYSNADGKTRCWVTLLPLSGGGAWVDYVYGLVSFETMPKGKAAEPQAPAAKDVEPEPQAEAVPEETAIVEEVEAAVDVEAPASEPEIESDLPDHGEIGAGAASAEGESTPETEEEILPDETVESAVAPEDAAPAKKAPGFSKLVDSLAGLTGFYAQGVKVEPVIEESTKAKVAAPEPAAEHAVEPDPEEEPLELVETAQPVAEAPANEPEEPTATPDKP